MIDEDGKTNVSGWRCDAERTVFEEMEIHNVEAYL